MRLLASDMNAGTQNVAKCCCFRFDVITVIFIIIIITIVVVVVVVVVIIIIIIVVVIHTHTHTRTEKQTTTSLTGQGLQQGGNHHRLELSVPRLLNPRCHGFLPGVQLEAFDVLQQLRAPTHSQIGQFLNGWMDG